MAGRKRHFLQIRRESVRVCYTRRGSVQAEPPLIGRAATRHDHDLPPLWRLEQAVAEQAANHRWRTKEHRLRLGQFVKNGTGQKCDSLGEIGNRNGRILQFGAERAFRAFARVKQQAYGAKMHATGPPRRLIRAAPTSHILRRPGPRQRGDVGRL